MFLLALPAWGQSVPSKTEVLDIMKKVADWQIEHFEKETRYGELNWVNGALYMGMADWAELASRTLKTDRYYDWLKNIGERNTWHVGKRTYHADDIVVGQAYIDLGRHYGDAGPMSYVKGRADYVLAHPSQGSFDLNYGKPKTLERWTWCDALFMAPPVYAKLYRETGDRKYLDFMDDEFHATYDTLYDRQAHLFFRDARYFNKREGNGEKVFWGRGNGWVMGGLAELLKELPAGQFKKAGRKFKNARSFYETLFAEMAASLAACQSADGYWRASLLDPASYPSPETSATGFITYALAYGINAKLLDKKTYLPVVEKGWNALTKAVETDGKLGYVQPVGADPQQVSRDKTAPYGVGAFLAAGCEIYKLTR